MENKYVNAVVSGLKPCVIGIILAVGSYMIIENFTPMIKTGIDIRTTVITAILAAIMFLSKPIIKKKPSPITLIVIAAVLGMIIYI